MLNMVQHQGTVAAQAPSFSGATQFTSASGVSLVVVPSSGEKDQFVRGLNAQYWFGNGTDGYSQWTAVRFVPGADGTEVTLAAKDKAPIILRLSPSGEAQLVGVDGDTFTSSAVSLDTSATTFHTSGYYRQPGKFLLERFGEVDPATPEDVSDDIRQFARDAGVRMKRFMEEIVEVPGHGKISRREAIELNVEKDFRHARAVIEAMGAWGMLATNFPDPFRPEEHQGMDVSLLEKTTFSQAVAANSSGSARIGVGGHTGIALSPILHYGTPEQKAKYLTAMCLGKRVGSFALTEPSAGTDVSGMKATAELVDKEGGGKVWRINGTKQFITNSTMSTDPEKPGQFILFAKVGGQITAFIVDGDTPGISVREEHKLGIKGSSTAQVNFADVEIPEDALLGKVGQGKEIAFSTLGKGRWSICAGNSGVLMASIRDAIEYASGRVSRGNPIINYGTNEEPLAEAITAAFLLDTLSHGVAGLFEGVLQASGNAADDKAEPKAWQTLGLETPLCKLFGSEESFYALLGALQIWGGNGYMIEYPMATRVADHLPDMIYEGANSMQRFGIFGREYLEAIMKRQTLPMPVANESTWTDREDYLQNRFAGHPLLEAMRLAEAGKETLNLITAAMFSAPDAFQILQVDQNSRGQHLLIELANVAMSVFASHYVVARALKMVDRYGAEACDVSTMIAMATVYQMDERARIAARRFINNIYRGRAEARRDALKHLEKLDLQPDIDLKDLQAKMAQAMAARGRYHLGMIQPLI